MPYCSECGIRYEETDTVCSSCGRDLGQEMTSETEVAFSEKPPGFQGDTHLGKGMIKPQTVEEDIDGIHFKYDPPPHSFIKAEPVKEKPQEYRITDAEMAGKSFDEIMVPKETISEEPSLAVVENTSQVDQAVESETTVECWESEVVLKKEEISLIPEPEIVPDPVQSKMESSLVSAEPELIWKASQTWFGILRRNSYRITNQSLIVFGKANHKLLEINLSLINEIALRRSWLGKLLDRGDLVISVLNFQDQKIILGGIPQPIKVKQLLEDLCKSKL